MPYRNSEKRKEKSRDAARSRRGKEAEIFSELASQLPLPSATIDALDKASVMRLLLATLKVRTVMTRRPKIEMPDPESLEAKLDTFYPKALDGFLISLSKEGDIIYVSDTVAKHLGLQQIDLMGQSIFEFTHPCDHEEIQEVLSPRTDDEEDAARTIFVRLKCTLTSKGRSVNLKSASYKVIKLTGKYVADHTVDEEMGEPESIDMEIDEDDETFSEDEENGPVKRRAFRPRALPHFLAVGEGIHHPSNIEVPLDRRTFTSRHNMNMKFTDVDDRIFRMIGYQPEELVGQSFFGYHHATDSKMMEKSFKDLFAKGQTCTGQYRFLAKNGGYVWMVTEATVIFNSKSQKPECVVCVHYCLSHVEQHGRILCDVQNRMSTGVKSESPTPSPSFAVPKKEEPKRQTCRQKGRLDIKVADIFHVPTFSTEAVFDDKTEDMEEEYYFPPGMTKKTVGKTDKLNLNHLAPRDGDVCIPLEIPPMDKLLKENYAHSLNLLDDFVNVEPRMEKMSPFTDTRKEMLSPNTMSPDSTMSAPSPSCYLSTINPKDITSPEEKFTNLEDEKSIDYVDRAPFIPMNADEDFILSQPTHDNFLDMGADFNPGIFGSTESVFSLKDELYDGPPTEKRSKTPQEMMGGSTVRKSIDRPQDQMMMKMKRPLDRSCLEKGPPVRKMTKYAAPIFNARPNLVTKLMEPKKDHSVLMNLLMRGEDKKNGYSVNHKPLMTSQMRGGPGFLHHLLTAVTSHDVEVNAPTVGTNLLSGQDIYNALNTQK